MSETNSLQNPHAEWQAQLRARLLREREQESLASQLRWSRGVQQTPTALRRPSAPQYLRPSSIAPVGNLSVEDEIKGAQRLAGLDSVDEVEQEHIYAYRQLLRLVTPGPDYDPARLFPRELNHDCDYASAQWLRRIMRAAERAGKRKQIERWLASGEQGFIDSMRHRRQTCAVEHAIECGATNPVELFNRPSGFANRRWRAVIESIALHGQMIGRDGQKKCSSFAMYAYKRSIERAEQYIKDHVITDGNIQVPLADAGGVAKKRLSELYAILKGIEKLAGALGMRWARIIVTLPSKYHPNPSKGKQSWDGALPTDGAAWLQEKWARVRARLHHHEIYASGVWTRELHGDMTPHVNFMLFFPPDKWQDVQREFCEVFGYKKPAVDFELGKVGDGSAKFANYCIKYFTKFFGKTTVKGNQEDGWTKDMDDDAWMRDAAGFSAFGIRRYGFIGLPALGQWRELRKLRHAPGSPELDKLWRAARGGKADEWIALSGGLAVARNKRPVQSIRTDNRVVGVQVVNDKREPVECIQTSTTGMWKIVKKSTLTVAINNPRGGQSPLDSVPAAPPPTEKLLH